MSTLACGLADLLLRNLDTDADRLLLRIDDHRLTYGECARRARGVAKGLIAAGVQPGSHVGLLMPTSEAFFASFFGVLMAGAVVVPMNTRFKTRELGYVLDHAHVEVLLTTAEGDALTNFVPLLQSTFPELASCAGTELRLSAAEALRRIVVIGDAAGGAAGFSAAEAFLAAGDDTDDAVVDERIAATRVSGAALVSYTSGTTANPKGCVLSHESISRNWREIGERLGITRDDRAWVPAPGFHAAGYGGVLMMAWVGGTALTQQHFTPEGATDLIVGDGATILYSPFAPVTQPVLASLEARHGSVGHVRTAIYAPPSPEDVAQVERVLPGVALVSLYGLTEVTAMATLHAPDDPAPMRAASAGRVMPGIEVRLVDPDTAADVMPGASGEILVRGYGVMQEYYRDPELTARTLDADGWLHTGDRGHFLEHRFLVFEGRIKDMLKVGGENVSPLEVEALLGGLAGVTAVQVVGAPDVRLGEVVAAFVMRSTGSSLSDADVIEFCRGKIAGYKVPRHVRFVDEFPMSATKVQKFRLREQLAAELADDRGGPS